MPTSLAPRTVLAAFFLLAAGAPLAAQDRPDPGAEPPIQALIEDLSFASWGRVRQAAAALESRQADAIPALLGLMNSEDRIDLTDTADLIYPGAETFYGHGTIVDYDIDWLAARAGWVLEELTFRDFGFSEHAIREETLLRAAAEHPATDLPLDQVIPSRDPAERRRSRAAAIERARSWWASRGAAPWSRLDDLVAALQGDATDRLVFTIGWIRYGTTRCDGLDLDTYRTRILPEIERLARCDHDGVRQQAALLLADREAYWLSLKP